MLGLVRQVGITGRGENRVMAEEFLDLDQIDSKRPANLSITHKYLYIIKILA